jgi:hypothetical protein
MGLIGLINSKKEKAHSSRTYALALGSGRCDTWGSATGEGPEGAATNVVLRIPRRQNTTVGDAAGDVRNRAGSSERRQRRAEAVFCSASGRSPAAFTAVGCRHIQQFLSHESMDDYRRDARIGSQCRCLYGGFDWNDLTHIDHNQQSQW